MQHSVCIYRQAEGRCTCMSAFFSTQNAHVLEHSHGGRSAAGKGAPLREATSCALYNPYSVHSVSVDEVLQDPARLVRIKVEVPSETIVLAAHWKPCIHEPCPSMCREHGRHSCATFAHWEAMLVHEQQDVVARQMLRQALHP